MNEEEYNREEYEKILKEIKDAEEIKKELEEKLKPLREQRKKELKKEIEKTLSDEGFYLEDIFGTSLNKNKKGSRKSPSTANYPTYCLKGDPKVKYTRGNPSQDIKDEMVKYGYDPKEKGSFKNFRDKYMTTEKPEETPQETSQEDA